MTPYTTQADATQTTAASNATSTSATAGNRSRPRRRSLLPAGLALALWRGRRTWRMWLLVELGMLAAVTLACAVPLFSRVATMGGLVGQLEQRPFDAELYVQVLTNHPSADLQMASEVHLKSNAARYMSAYHLGTPIAELITQPIKLTTVPDHAADSLSIAALSEDDFAHEVRLVSGRLPQPAANGLEVALTQATADDLHVSTGNTITLPPPAATSASAPPLELHIVGIVAPIPNPRGSDVHSYQQEVLGDTGTFEPQRPIHPDGPRDERYYALASEDAVFTSSYSWQSLAPTNIVQYGEHPALWSLQWAFPMQFNKLSEAEANNLLTENPFRSMAFVEQPLLQLPNVEHIGITSGIFETIDNYQHRVFAAEMAAAVLIIDVLALVLMFLVLMANVLVEAQASVIASLRSRGASRQQIFIAFAGQSLVFSLLALFTGPLLAIPLTRIAITALFAAEDQKGLVVLAGTPLTTAASLAPIAALAVSAAIVAVLWSTWRTSKMNVLTQRAEAARSTTQPLWQRLHLDIAMAVLALCGYTTFAITNAVASADSTTSSMQTRLAIAPLALLAPTFLLVACTLLVLRGYSPLLHLGSWLAGRGRGASTVLAFTQLARSSRHAVRISLLLALTTGFALFAIAAKTTLSTFAQDAAAYQAGADFSGGISTPAGATNTDLSTQTAAYASITGVRSATLGYRPYPLTIMRDPTYKLGDVQLLAADADSFASTALWSDRDHDQPLADLMALLTTHRADAVAHDAVYAIVDSNAWTSLNLREGAPFTLPIPGHTSIDAGAEMHFIAAARVQRIPSVYTRPSGGILVDYQSYAAVYAHDTGDTSSHIVAPNFVWLRTAGDPASLASVRSAVSAGPLQLDTLYPNDQPYRIPVTDRRALALALTRDPFHVEIIGILILGSATAILLALFGSIIASWLHTRQRLTTLILLRALGMSPRRILAMMLCEQSIIYAIGLTLGVLLGAVLANITLTSLPDLILSSAFSGPIQEGGDPARFIWPWPSIAAILAVLTLICALSVALHAILIARPSLTRTLRLNDN